MRRRIDEWGSIVERLPPLDRTYQIDFRLLSDRLAEIPDELNGILKLFDGRRTLAQVLDEAGPDVVAAAKALARLWAEEIIRPAVPARERSTPPPQPSAPSQGEIRGVAPQPEAADWFSGPAEADAGPPPSAAGSARVPGAAPRIVRFPAKPREPQRSPEIEAAPAGEPPKAAAAEERRPVSSLRALTRRGAPPTAAPGRRALAAALVLAASVLAAIGIWRIVVSVK